MKEKISLKELPDFVKNFLNNLKNKNTATVVGLCGDLGSGKTTFVKELAKQLGVVGEITSPTFTVMQRYEIQDSRFKNQDFKNLVHIDLYRFEKSEELKVLRLEEIFAEKENLVLVEWADKFWGERGSREWGVGSGEKSKEDFIKINFKHCDEEDKREIEIIYG